MDISRHDLIEFAKKFDALERNCIELMHDMREGNIGDFDEWFHEMSNNNVNAYDLWGKIRLHLGTYKRLSISDSRIQDTIRDIRDDKDFCTIRNYTILAKILNKDIKNIDDQTPLDLEDFIRESFDDVYSDFNEWFDVCDYYFRAAQIGCLIGFSGFDEITDDYFTEIREAYAYGLNGACVSLCRALIELVLYKALKKKRLLKQAASFYGNEIKEEYSLFDMIGMAARYKILTRKEPKIAHNVRKIACGVLHFKTSGRNNVEMISSEIALEVARDTVVVVEGVLSK